MRKRGVVRGQDVLRRLAHGCGSSHSRRGAYSKVRRVRYRVVMQQPTASWVTTVRCAVLERGTSHPQFPMLLIDTIQYNFIYDNNTHS